MKDKKVILIIDEKEERFYTLKEAETRLMKSKKRNGKLIRMQQ